MAEEEDLAATTTDRVDEGDDAKREGATTTMKGLPGSSVRLETTLRMTAAACLAYSLSYASLPDIIPPSQKWLVGMLGSIITLRIPVYIFASGLMMPLTFTVLLFGLASVTMVLCAATVSDGFFVAVIAIWSFWVSGLRYGKFGKLTGVFPGALVVVLGLLGLGLHRLVRDGITITISRPLLEMMQAALAAGGGNATTGGGQERRLSSLLGSLDPSDERLVPYIQAIAQAVQVVFATGEAVDIEIDSGLLEGRSAQVNIDQQTGSLTIHFDGGIWLIKRFWTWSGLENPLAAMQNFLVAAAWTLLCAFSSSLLPPWRTYRWDSTHLFIPALLRQTASFLKEYLSSNKEGGSGQLVDYDLELSGKLLMDNSRVFFGGGAAAPTAFEPRIWDYRPGRPVVCTWLKLKSLAEAVHLASTAPLAMSAFASAGDPFTLEEIKGFESAIGLYEGAASSLESRTQATLPVAEEKKKFKAVNTDDSESAFLASDSATWTADRLIKAKVLDVAKQVTELTNDYVEALDPSKYGKEGSAKDFVSNVAPWLATPFVLFYRLLEFPLQPVMIAKGRAELDIGKLFQCVKFALGFTILTCMTVYWDWWRDTEIAESDNEDENSAVSFTGAGPDSYAGWHLIAYAFATMPTTEGTVKKCVLRLVGTLAGAFSAWLALLASSDNEYGMVAWLTITTFIATYHTVDNDLPSGRLGTSKDHGYGGFYFVLTQSVITMQFLGGVDDRDTLVANRIVSNITGILMAAILSMIPPAVYGGDPARAGKMVEVLQVEFSKLLALLLASDKEGFDSQFPEFRKTLEASRSDVMYLIEDAERLSMFPLYRVDKNLVYTVGSIAETEALITYLFLFVKDEFMQDADAMACFAEGTEARREMDQFLKMLDPAEADGEVAMETEAGNARHDVALIIQTVKIVVKRIKDHRLELAKVKFGLYN